MELQDLTARLESLESANPQVRRWGFEAEHPAIQYAIDGSMYREQRPFEFVNDGSVETIDRDCECSCRECTYHECNCDFCDDYNDDPSHCGSESCDAKNELSTANPILTYWDSEMDTFLDYCAQAEAEHGYNPRGENWGGHVHVEARDLSRRALMTALTIANHVFESAPEWLIGWQDNYNTATISDQAKRDFQSGKRNSIDRALPVTAYNLAWESEPRAYAIGDMPDGRKTTIEFRLFRTTFDPELIKARGAIARAIVSYAKRNELGAYWVTRLTDFEAMLDELEVGHH